MDDLHQGMGRKARAITASKRTDYNFVSMSRQYHLRGRFPGAYAYSDYYLRLQRVLLRLGSRLELLRLSADSLKFFVELSASNWRVFSLNALRRVNLS